MVSNAPVPAAGDTERLPRPAPASLIETAKMPAGQSAATAKVVWGGDARPQSTAAEMQKPPADATNRARAEVPAEKKPAKPAVVTARAAVPPPSRRPNWIGLSAAAVIVAAIGGAFWLRVGEEPVSAREEQSTESSAEYVAREAADVEERVVANASPVPVAPAAPVVPAASAALASDTRHPVSAAPPKPKPASRPVAAPAVRPVRVSAAVPVKPVAAPSAPPREVATVAAAAPEPAAPAAAPARAAAAPAPREAAPAAPIGPFFETKDVSELPRVATRVPPRLASALRSPQASDVVIVRALVSQSGHPSRISLLRRSKSGPEVDELVIAAVKQWTFSPATKKGEAVSCWFNFGVPVGQAD
jgi:TonB family protein